MVGKIKLLIAIEDDIYLDRICDYLESVDGRFLTERFSDRQALAKRMAQKPKYDISLLEPGFLHEGSGEISGIQVLLGSANRFELVEGRYEILLYQKLDDIAGAVLRICSIDERFTGLEAAGGAQTRLHAFLSPSGGAGTTTLALAAGMHLAALGRRTLYINLEHVSALGRLLPTNGGVTMTQIMRLVIERNAKLPTTVEGEKLKEPASGMEYFAPFLDVTDFDSLEPHHVKGLVQQFRGLGIYNEVIVDSSWNTRLNAPLMETADSTVLVARNTDVSVEKINAFLRQIFQREAPYRHRVKVAVNGAGGGVNGNLAVQPLAAVPNYPLVVDCTGFPEAALGANPLSKGVQQLALQL